MRKRVYIETTIPSFYFEQRLAPEMVARRNWTEDWWNEHAPRFDLDVALIERRRPPARGWTSAHTAPPPRTR